MALINIMSDVFDIVDRVKEIDEGYFIVYNTSKNRYEVHNKKQFGSTFCITCENGLNSQVITKLRKSKIENIEKILKEIEQNNQKIEENNKKIAHSETSFKLEEMFNYASKRESDCSFDDSYQTSWA